MATWLRITLEVTLDTITKILKEMGEQDECIDSGRRPAGGRTAKDT